MTLKEKQFVFSRLVARLIIQANMFGFEVSLGEAYRSKEEAERLAKLGKGIKGSLHTQRLAIDLNLFRNGRLITDTEGHKVLGEWWEKHSTDKYDCVWGGRFNDGNHYSIAHDGRK